MDFAAYLGIGVDTSDLAKAESALKGLATTGANTERALSGQMTDVTRSMQQAATNVGISSQRMERQTRQAVSNLSYQLTDIGQMLAVGQSPFIMMMQQGEQTAGAMRDLSRSGGVLSGLRAALATIANPISLMTFAVIGFSGVAVAAFREVWGEVQTFEDSLKSASSAIDEYLDLQTKGDANFSDMFKSARAELEATSRAYQDLIAISRIEAFNSVQNLNQSLADSVLSASYLKTEFQDVRNLLEWDTTLHGHIGLWKDQRAVVHDFKAQLEELGEATELNEQYAAALRIRESFLALVGPMEDMTASQLDFFKQLSQSVQQMELLGASTDAVAKVVSARLVNAYDQYYQSRVAGEELVAKQEQRNQEAWEQYYDSRVKGAEFLVNTVNAEAAKAQAGYEEYYQSRVQGEEFLANRTLEHAEKSRDAYNQYYQSRVEGEKLVAAEEQKAVEAWEQYYDSRVTGAEYIASREAEVSERLRTGYEQYYQSRIRGEELVAAQEQRNAGAWLEYYQSRVTGAEYLVNKEAEQASALEKVYQAYADTRVEANKLSEYTDNLLQTEADRLSVQEAILAFGRDSIQAAEAQWSIEQRVTAERLRALGVAESVVQEVLSANDAANRAAFAAGNMTTNLENGANAAIRLRNALSDADSAIATIGLDVERKIAVVKAKTLALQKGQNEAVAGEVALLRQKLNEQTSNLVVAGSTIDAAVEATAAEREKISVLESASTTYENLRDETQAASRAATAGGKASSAAFKETEKAAGELADEIERLEFEADPLKKYNAELSNLGMLARNGLTDGAYAAAVADLNEEFVQTSPILSGINDAFGQMVDYMFDGFKDGMKGIWNIFVNTLKSMAAAALKNKITISIGAAGASAGAAAAGAPGGGGGMLGQIGQITGIGSAFMGGMSNVIGSTFGAGGSFAMGLQSIGAQVSAAIAGPTLSSVSAALGAVALPVAAVVGAILAFKKTTVTVAEGVRAEIDGATLALDSYVKTKENNGLGFSSGFDREFTRLDDAVQSAVGARLNATIDALGAFGLGTDLTGFSFSKRTEIKEGETFEGESEEVIREALDAAIEFLADGALDVFQRTGESLSETLDRLTISLNSVNPIVDMLGTRMLDVSLDGAAAASALIEVAGGLEAFANEAAFIFENFNTDAAKKHIAIDQLGNAMRELGVSSIPATHDAFMDLLNAQDLATTGGREMYAALLDIAPLFVRVKGTAQEAADAAANELVPALDGAGDSLSNLAAIERERAGLLAQIARLEGDTEYLRQQEIDAADESNVHLVERIHNLQDEVDAARELAAQQREQESLLLQIARMTGNVDYIRRQEVAALDATLQPLQEHIHLLEDQTVAVETQNAALRDALATAQEALSIAEGAFDSAVNVLRGLVENAEEQLSAAEDAARRAFGAQADTVRAEFGGMIDAVNTAADAQIALAQEQVDAINAEREAAAERAALQAVAVRDQISLLEGVLGSLESALDNRRALTPEGRLMELAQSQAFLGNAVANGGTTDFDALEQALAIVADPSTDLFKSFEDYQFDFAVNTGFIKKLRDLTDDALSVEEKTLAALDAQTETIEAQIAASREGITAQIDAINAARDAEIAALEAEMEAQLDRLDQQLNALLGIDTSVLTIAEAQAGLLAAQELVVAANEALLQVTQEGNANIVASLGAIQTALDAALAAQVAVTDAADAADAAQDAVDQATGGGGGTGTGGGFGLSSAEKRLLSILGDLDGAAGVAALGAGAFSYFSEDNMNAILSDSGVAALSGLAGDIAGVFQDTLGRNADVAGLQFYIDQVENNGLTLSEISTDIGGSVEALTQLIPGFSTAVSDAIYGINAAANVAVSAAEVSATAAANSASASATAIEAADRALAAAQAAEASAASAASRPEVQTGGMYDILLGDGRTYGEYLADANVPSYANGTSFHPGGFARLHENEMVNLPRGTSVSTAGEVREMVELNRKLVQQNEQNAAEMRQMRRLLTDLADIEGDRRAEELSA